MTDSNRMDPAVKAQWVEALRSGKYEQAAGCLRDSTGFCCLGVLCDLHDPTEWNDQLDSDRSCYGIWASTYPPSDVRSWARLPHEMEAEVATMNDHGKSFSEIADFIEQNL